MPALPRPEPRPDPALQPAFDAAVHAIGRDPGEAWIGGYVAYEWRFLRAVLAAYGQAMQQPDGAPLRVLEFGSNVGASSVVMAALGAIVTGVDVDAGYVRVAQANAALHGQGDRVRIVHCPDTRALPFAAGSFDFVLANSVLEYVAPDHLAQVVAELHRVCAPGGQLFVCGTASRLAPRELHSGRWLVNYWPSALDLLFGNETLQRGLAPWRLAGAMRERFAVVQRQDWLAARRAIHGRAGIAVRVVAAVAGLLGIAPGWLSPHIELMARREG